MTYNLFNYPSPERNIHIDEAVDILGCDYRELGHLCILENQCRTDWLLADDVRDLLAAKRRKAAEQAQAQAEKAPQTTDTTAACMASPEPEER